MFTDLKIRIIETFGSQWDFAKKLGVCESKVSEVIHRKKTLSDLEKQRWALFLNDDPKRLFS